MLFRVIKSLYRLGNKCSGHCLSTVIRTVKLNSLYTQSCIISTAWMLKNRAKKQCCSKTFYTHMVKSKVKMWVFVRSIIFQHSFFVSSGLHCWLMKALKMDIRKVSNDLLWWWCKLCLHLSPLELNCWLHRSWLEQCWCHLTCTVEFYSRLFFYNNYF